MILNEQEKAYLREMQESPIWKNILNKLKIAKPSSRYTPSKKDQNYDLWVYESGGLAATEAILSLLSLQPTNIEEKHE